MFLLSVRKQRVLSLTREGQNALKFFPALLTVSIRCSADDSVGVFTFSARSGSELKTSMISIASSIPCGYA